MKLRFFAGDFLGWLAGWLAGNPFDINLLSEIINKSFGNARHETQLINKRTARGRGRGMDQYLVLAPLLAVDFDDVKMNE